MSTPEPSASEPQPVQLPYAIIEDASLRLPPDLPAGASSTHVSREIPGRRVPDRVPFSDLSSVSLADRAVPLPEANTLGHLHFQARWFGRLQRGSGELALFNPETVLVKFRTQPHVVAIRVEPMCEWAAVQALAARADVQFAELDVLQQRQFSPRDPQVTNQWHHAVLGSFAAWDLGLGRANVSVAIVDTPFQMSHPDLAANTVAGWDVVANVPVTSGTGIVHSTLCAGLAGAVINNGLGVAGMANCSILPININGLTSEMYNAIAWAADHGVRVVSLSWSGANSDTLEAAAYYLRTNTQGIVAMSAIDGSGYLNWTNQPDIYCISTTDQYDNTWGTKPGPYVDFAAPGYQVYATTTNGGYGAGSGTSYAAPLFAGVVAWLFSLNPTLGPDDVIGILQQTAVDLGEAGWDPYYGWGRIDFGAAATAAAATLPLISGIQIDHGQVTLSALAKSGLLYSLWRAPSLAPADWILVTNAIPSINAGSVFLTDPAPPPSNACYRIGAAVH